MGMSTYVIGLRTKEDPVYRAHLAVLEACLNARIERLPKETADYFGSDYPEDVNPEDVLQVEMPKTEYSDGDMTEGYEINVADIPQGVETIRFVNSY